MHSFVLHSHLLTLKPVPTPTQTTYQTASRSLSLSLFLNVSFLVTTHFLFPLLYLWFSISLAFFDFIIWLSTIFTQALWHLQNLSHPSLSYYKLFACRAIGFSWQQARQRDAWAAGVPVWVWRRRMFSVLIFSHCCLWVVWVTRVFVYLLQITNHWSRFVSTWRASFLLLLTTHTHTHVCIYKPVIYVL